MDAFAANGPPVNQRTITAKDLRSLLRPRRGSKARTSVGLAVSIAAHVAVFGGAWLYAQIAPPRTIPEKPIIARLVVLGHPSRHHFLPRNSIAAGPHAHHGHSMPQPIEAPMVLTVPRPAPSDDSDKASDGQAAQAKAREAIERQKRLQEALAQLETPKTGEAKTVNQRVGSENGSVDGDSDTAAAGDMYLAQVKDALKKNFVIPSTISQSDRLYLQCLLRIFISDSGKIVRYSIDKGSGNEEYDRAVEATLQHTQLPPPPESLRQKYSQQGLPVRFKPI